MPSNRLKTVNCIWRELEKRRFSTEEEILELGDTIQKRMKLVSPLSASTYLGSGVNLSRPEFHVDARYHFHGIADPHRVVVQEKDEFDDEEYDEIYQKYISTEKIHLPDFIGMIFPLALRHRVNITIEWPCCEYNLIYKRRGYKLEICMENYCRMRKGCFQSILDHATKLGIKLKK